MNREFLELLMYFHKKAESGVDNIKDELKLAQTICKECGVTSDVKMKVALSEAETTVAILEQLLDSYWSAQL